jgi:hypothetical protein
MRGWRFNGVNGCWWHKNTPVNDSFALSIKRAVESV